MKGSEHSSGAVTHLVRQQYSGRKENHQTSSQPHQLFGFPSLSASLGFLIEEMEIPAHKVSTKPWLARDGNSVACSHFTPLLSVLCYPLPLDSFPPPFHHTLKQQNLLLHSKQFSILRLDYQVHFLTVPSFFSPELKSHFLNLLQC